MPTPKFIVFRSKLGAGAQAFSPLLKAFTLNAVESVSTSLPTMITLSTSLPVVITLSKEVKVLGQNS